jgi:hypothetical protein
MPLGVSLAPRDDLEVNLGGRLASGAERHTGCHLLQIQFVEVACESALGALVHALPANGFVPLRNSQLPSPQQPTQRKGCSRPGQPFPIRFYRLSAPTPLIGGLGHIGRSQIHKRKAVDLPDHVLPCQGDICPRIHSCLNNLRVTYACAAHSSIGTLQSTSTCST